MNKNVLKQQLIRELDEISIPELFQAFPFQLNSFLIALI